MEEPDFSGIDPVRVPEARRRIAAIRAYLALPNPRTADAIRIGESVGLSRWTFVRLARAWSEYGEARRLVLDRRADSGRGTIIDPIAAAIIDEATEEFGADAKLATIAKWVEARCLDAGVATPADTTIWKRMRKTRAAKNAPTSGPPRIIVGRMWFHLPVEGHPSGSMPMALVAVMLPERLIVAHRVSVDPEAWPSVSGLIEDLAGRQTPGGEVRPLLLAADDLRASAAKLDAVGLGDLRPHRRALQIELSKAFRGKLGQLKASYRPTTRAAKKPKIIQARPLTEAEAADAITTAIEAHNSATLMLVPAFMFAARHS